MSVAWRRVIGALEIIGGASGLALLSWEIAQVQLNIILLIFALILFSLYILSLLAGVLLWRDHKWGRLTSIIVQAAQLPKIFTPILVFNICFGLDVYPYLMVGTTDGFSFYSIGADMKLLAFHQLHINATFPAAGLGVSIPACIFLTALIKNRGARAPHERFYVPPPTDPRYLNWPPDPSQGQFTQPPGSQAAADQDDPDKARQP